MSITPRPANWRQRPKFWTAPRLFALAGMIEQGKSDAEIGAHFGKSATAIQLARKRHGIRPRRLQALSARAIADELGVACSKTVTRWIELGYLRGRRGQRFGLHRQYWVTREQLDEFLDNPDNWHLWSPERIPDPQLRRHYSERRTERYLMLTEVAERCFVVRGTVGSWLDKGWLPFVRNCRNNRLVPASALDGWIPPGRRSKVGLVRRTWSTDADALLLRLRADGKCWREIGRALGRPHRAAAQRYYRLIKRDVQP